MHLRGHCEMKLQFIPAILFFASSLIDAAGQANLNQVLTDLISLTTAQSNGQNRPQIKVLAIKPSSNPKIQVSAAPILVTLPDGSITQATPLQFAPQQHPMAEPARRVSPAFALQDGRDITFLHQVPLKSQNKGETMGLEEHQPENVPISFKISFNGAVKECTLETKNVEVKKDKGGTTNKLFMTQSFNCH